MGMLARLGVVLGLDSAEFSKGIEQANKKLDDLSSAARSAAVVGAAAFAAMTAKALQYADAVADTAKANEMAISSVLALSKGLKLNGGEADNAGKLLASFTAKIDEAAQGSKDAQLMFQRIGVSLQDIANKDMTDLFDQVIQSLARMSDPISRNALAMQTFGKAAKGVDFVGLAQGTGQTRAEFAKYATAIQQAADLNDELAEKASKVAIRFTQEVIPTLVQLFDVLSSDSDAMDGFWWILREGSKAAAMIMKTMVTVVQGLTADVTLLVKSLEALFKWDNSIFQRAYFEHEQKMRDLIASDKEFEERLFGPKKTTAAKLPGVSVTAKREVTPYKDAEAERLRIALGLAERLSEEYRRQSEFELAQVVRRTKLMQLTENEREVEEAVLRVRDQNSKQLEDIDKKITEAILKRETQLAEELMFQKEQIRLMGEVYEDQTRVAVERQQQIRNSFEFGWNQAYKQFAEDSENYAKLGQQAFMVFSTNISSAINTFVETGKIKFNDFVKSILLGLIKIELQMQAMQLFKMGKSWLGGMFSFGSQSPAPIVDAVFTPVGSAAGGYIDGPRLVGENGPEIFIPQSAGTVIPNQRLGSQFGNQPQVVYNGPYIAQMSAIDTQSAAQFLARNKDFVWAANQSASRAVPASR